MLNDDGILHNIHCSFLHDDDHGRRESSHGSRRNSVVEEVDHAVEEADKNDDIQNHVVDNEIHHRTQDKHDDCLVEKNDHGDADRNQQETHDGD